MDSSHKRLGLSGLMLLGISLGYLPTTYAAKEIDLTKQPLSVLHQFISNQKIDGNELKIYETSRSFDPNQNYHIRIQQAYQNIPIWGADAVIHVNKSVGNQSLNVVVLRANRSQVSMNGSLYQDISKDLARTSLSTLQTKRDSLMQKAITTYQQKIGGKPAVSNQEAQLLVYIAKDNKAHWAYKINFDADAVHANKLPAKPVYIMDALTAEVYEQWDNIQTIENVDASGGGLGGNEKMGKLIYDGLQADLPKLNIQRDAETNLCSLQNADVTVKHYRGGKIINYTCNAPDADHNDVYWWGDNDAVNGGFSPSDDALFGGAVIKDMYMKWYGVPVLTKDGKPMMLTMVVHDPIDNAYWDGSKMTFGDGVSMFYPLTSLGVAAHEISHGFTQQHSNLTYRGQSGGMNEAFSDIAAQGAEFYAYGKNSWQIGPEIFKEQDRALRYMDQPSKDCRGGTPGDWCSIDTADQYQDGLDVHYSSGVYNHFFYILGNTEGWDTKKAFDVMVKANMNYWTSNSNFKTAACGVISAANDLGYDVQAVKNAFDAVKVSTDECK